MICENTAVLLFSDDDLCSEPNVRHFLMTGAVVTIYSSLRSLSMHRNPARVKETPFPKQTKDPALHSATQSHNKSTGVPDEYNLTGRDDSSSEIPCPQLLQQLWSLWKGGEREREAKTCDREQAACTERLKVGVSEGGDRDRECK